MMGEDGQLTRLAYICMAALAGAVTALSFRPFSKMTKMEIFMALFVGASFAIFVGPWVVRAVLGASAADPRLEAGIYYLMASGSNALIPLAVRKLGHFFGFRQEDKP